MINTVVKRCTISADDPVLDCLVWIMEALNCNPTEPYLCSLGKDMILNFINI